MIHLWNPPTSNFVQIWKSLSRPLWSETCELFFHFTTSSDRKDHQSWEIVHLSPWSLTAICLSPLWVSRLSYCSAILSCLFLPYEYSVMNPDISLSAFFCPLTAVRMAFLCRKRKTFEVNIQWYMTYIQRTHVLNFFQIFCTDILVAHALGITSWFVI